MAKWWRNQSQVNEKFNNRTMLSRLPKGRPGPSKLLVNLFVLVRDNDYKYPGNTVRDDNGRKL